MSDCIFCKIVAGEIPAEKIYEDNETLAFLDIAPVNKGHVLVITKKHFANMEEIDEQTLCSMVKNVKKIGLALKKGLGIAGYNIQVNNDPIAGQIIPHVHFHIIPRVEGDGLKLWPQGKYIEGEVEKVADKIKNNL
ncbi:MAG TPA: HIT family protein [Candidatus Moranbacteria bacterium]|nr:HIT family protein [Candidatus Moranbacteria bacterium]